MTLDSNKERADLAARAASDPQAFIALYDLYFKRVFNYICVRCTDPCTADDLTAQVFERLLEKISQYNPARGQFDAWLFAIVRNTINGYFRRKRFAWLSLESLRYEPAAEHSPEDLAIHTESQNELLRAFTCLDDRSRDLLSLKFSAGLDTRTISVLTGLTESNVRVRLHRVIERLRTLLTEKDGSGKQFTYRETSHE